MPEGWPRDARRIGQGATSPGPRGKTHCGSLRARAGCFQYVVYQTGKWKFNNRLDYATGSNGAYGYTSTSDDPHNQLFSYTLTTDYALWANVISRAEFRWDHALSGDRPFGGTAVGAPRDKNAVSLGLNLIYIF